MTPYTFCGGGGGGGPNVAKTILYVVCTWIATKTLVNRRGKGGPTPYNPNNRTPKIIVH